MKLWEALKALDEKPNKVFESGKRIIRNNQGKIVVQKLDGTRFLFDYQDADDDWLEIKQSVTWQEAIQAWVDGNTVVWERDADGDRSTFKAYVDALRAMEDEHGVPIRLKHLNSGKWYVED